MSISSEVLRFIMTDGASGLSRRKETVSLNPFDVVRQFEAALCEYTGARYAVTTTSCTMAILLAVAYHLFDKDKWRTGFIPKRTYISLAMSIIHAGGNVRFRDEDWVGAYQLEPTPI